MERNLEDTDIAEFIKENPPLGRKPRVASQKAKIQKLLDLGYSQNQIIKFLSEKCGISISQAALSRFIAGMRKAGLVTRSVLQVQDSQVQSTAHHDLTPSETDKTGGIIEAEPADIVQKVKSPGLNIKKYQKEA